HRMGYTHALVPADPGMLPRGMTVTEVANMGDALRVLPRGRRRSDGAKDGEGAAGRTGGGPETAPW
ncbi:DNA repair protein RadA, partial [Streptomyces sp. NPDC058953]